MGDRGTPVGPGVNGSAISVNVPSETGALVLDVLFGHNSTTAHTTGAGQSARWNTNTTGGTNNLRGAGTSEAGAATTTMSWTSVGCDAPRPPCRQLQPRHSAEPTAPGAPNLAAATAGNASVALSWTAPVSDGGARSPATDLARHHQRRGQPADHGRAGHQLHRHRRRQRHDLLLPGRRGQRRRQRSGLERAQRHAHRATAAHRAGCAQPDRRHRRQRQRRAELDRTVSDGGSPLTGYKI